MRLFLLVLTFALSQNLMAKNKRPPCHREAQKAVYKLAAINKLNAQSNGEGYYIVDATTEEGILTTWKTKNDKFVIITNPGRGESTCYVSSVVFNPEP